MTLRISAIICTFNRADYLQKALNSLIDDTLPRDQYEIIVVDNRSQDHTRQVVATFEDRLPLRYHFEPVQGVSRARNAGISLSQGEYIAFMDDDAEAHPGWLAGFLRTFDHFAPPPGCIGGRCEPIWEVPRPAWLADDLLGMLSVFHWADTPVVLNDNQWLSICNMACPRGVLDRVGGFRENLGRLGSVPRTAPETYLRRQLDALGLPSVYDPAVVVGHHITADRLRQSWFRRAAYWQGLSAAAMLKLDHPELTRPRRAWLAFRRVLWAMPRLGIMLTGRQWSARFRRQCQGLQTAGFIVGLWN